jgi:hypothetical protein
MVTGFLHGSPERQRRTLRITGLAVVVVVAVAVLWQANIVPTGRSDNRILSVTVETPSVGSGVAPGTDVALHGAVVGSVSDLHFNAEGSAVLTLDLDSSKVEGMRDDFTFDYRPLNYFGVTAVNITSAGTADAAVLVDDSRVQRSAGADYTMTMIIEEASKVANGSLDAEAVEVIRRSLSYSAALQPLIHSGVVITDTIARAQKALPSNTIRDFNEFVSAMGPFGDAAISAGYDAYKSDLLHGPDWAQHNVKLGLEAVANKFFGLLGELLGDTKKYLSATLEMVEEAAGILPAVAGGVLTPVTLRRLLNNLDGAFVPSPGSGATLKVNLALDVLPALQGPVASAQPTDGGER